MNAHRHVLIRMKRTATASPFLRRLPTPASSEAGPSSLDISQIDASDADIARLSAEPTVLAVPRVIPTRLIEPRPAQAVAAAPVAWGVTETGAAASAFDGNGVRVAVLDTGIDAAHAAFAGVRLHEADFTGEGGGDGNGHGTHCAGTIFGRDVGGTRIGLARGVGEAMIGKVLDARGSGDSNMLFQALAWSIGNGAQVISMSLGFDFPGYVEYLVQQEDYPVGVATSVALRDYTANLRAFDALMDYARSQVPFAGGAVVVAAAGNESALPDRPISASVPAAAEGVLSVGALESTPAGLALATFSNTDVQLVAPGVGVVSARHGGGLVAKSGTSMACPHVAGAAALWWQAIAGQGLPATAVSVAARLLATATRDRLVGYAPHLHGQGLAKAP